jgi:phosphoribosylformylglycinamidine synthase
MKATILIRPQHGVPDFEGEAMMQRLAEAGYSEISEVRIGRVIDLRLEVTDEIGLERRLETLCKRLLSHPQTEDFKVLEIVEE